MGKTSHTMQESWDTSWEEEEEEEEGKGEEWEGEGRGRGLTSASPSGYSGLSS